MSRKHFDMHVSSYTPTGYAQYMIEMERIKHQLQIGKEYDHVTGRARRKRRYRMILSSGARRRRFSRWPQKVCSVSVCRLWSGTWCAT